MTLLERRKMIELQVQSYKDDFYTKFGTELMISIKGTIDSIAQISLNELGIIIDGIVHIQFPGKYPDGIKTKSRNIDILNFRQCYCKIAIDKRHTSVAIAKALGFDHATVLHSNKYINTMIETRDDRTLFNLNTIYNELQERFGINADIQSDQSAEPNT